MICAVAADLLPRLTSALLGLRTPRGPRPTQNGVNRWKLPLVRVGQQWAATGGSGH
jgi:hypothetical protein